MQRENPADEIPERPHRDRYGGKSTRAKKHTSGEMKEISDGEMKRNGRNARGAREEKRRKIEEEIEDDGQNGEASDEARSDEGEDRSGEDEDAHQGAMEPGPRGLPNIELYRHHRPNFASLPVFRMFMKRDPSLPGGRDASGIVTRECFEYWCETRRVLSPNPEKAFQRALCAHLTGCDGRIPFTEAEELAVLRVLRTKGVCKCFEHLPNLQASAGFRARGYHEKRRMSQAAELAARVASSRNSPLRSSSSSSSSSTPPVVPLNINATTTTTQLPLHLRGAMMPSYLPAQPQVPYYGHYQPAVQYPYHNNNMLVMPPGVTGYPVGTIMPQPPQPPSARPPATTTTTTFPMPLANARHQSLEAFMASLWSLRGPLTGSNINMGASNTATTSELPPSATTALDTLFRMCRIQALVMGLCSSLPPSPQEAAQYRDNVTRILDEAEEASSAEGEGFVALDPGARTVSEIVTYQSKRTHAWFGDLIKDPYVFFPLEELWTMLQLSVEAAKDPSSRKSMARTTKVRGRGAEREMVVGACLMEDVLGGGSLPAVYSSSSTTGTATTATTTATSQQARGRTTSESSSMMGRRAMLVFSFREVNGGGVTG